MTIELINKQIDELNEISKKLSKYDKFYPSYFFIEKLSNDKLDLKIKYIDNNDANYLEEKIKIDTNKKEDLLWVDNTIDIQKQIYQMIIRDLELLDREEHIFELKDDKYIFTDNKTLNTDYVQSRINLSKLNIFDLMKKFKNYSIDDMIGIKKDLTIESFKKRVNSMLKLIKDNSIRIKNIKDAPLFEVSEKHEDDYIVINVMSGEETVFSSDIDIKTSTKDELMNYLIKLALTTRMTINVLNFYRKLVGITNPKIYSSKLFKKQWMPTILGKKIMECIDVKKMIITIYNID